MYNEQANRNVQALAQAYNRENAKRYQLTRIVEDHYVPVDKRLALMIAGQYEQLRSYAHDDPNVSEAYRQLGVEIERQYAYAQWAGIQFIPWTQEGQPYHYSHELWADVRYNNRLYFFTGGEVHPLLNAVYGLDGLSLNDKLRAIHDLFGHCAEGFQWGIRGEENAWIHHSMMFSPQAQLALTTETRGQNSWFNFGPHAELAPQDRPFAEQKVDLLPLKFCDWKSALARQEDKT